MLVGDSGNPGYDYESAARQYCVSPAAHSGIGVDGYTWIAIREAERAAVWWRAPHSTRPTRSSPRIRGSLLTTAWRGDCSSTGREDRLAVIDELWATG